MTQEMKNKAKTKDDPRLGAEENRSGTHGETIGGMVKPWRNHWEIRRGTFRKYGKTWGETVDAMGKTLGNWTT